MSVITVESGLIGRLFLHTIKYSKYIIVSKSWVIRAFGLVIRQSAPESPVESEVQFLPLALLWEDFRLPRKYVYLPNPLFAFCAKFGQFGFRVSLFVTTLNDKCDAQKPSVTHSTLSLIVPRNEVERGRGFMANTSVNSTEKGTI